MDEETHVRALLPGAGFRMLDGDRTDIAAFKMQRDTGALSVPPQSQRHIAAAGGDVENARSVLDSCRSNLTQRRPEYAGTGDSTS